MARARPAAERPVPEVPAVAQRIAVQVVRPRPVKRNRHSFHTPVRTTGHRHRRLVATAGGIDDRTGAGDRRVDRAVVHRQCHRVRPRRHVRMARARPAAERPVPEVPAVAQRIAVQVVRPRPVKRNRHSFHTPVRTTGHRHRRLVATARVPRTLRLAARRHVPRARRQQQLVHVHPVLAHPHADRVHPGTGDVHRRHLTAAPAVRPDPARTGLDTDPLRRRGLRSVQTRVQRVVRRRGRPTQHPHVVRARLAEIHLVIQPRTGRSVIRLDARAARRLRLQCAAPRIPRRRRYLHPVVTALRRVPVVVLRLHHHQSVRSSRLDERCSVQGKRENNSGDEPLA